MSNQPVPWSVVQVMLESQDEAERLCIAAERLGLSATRYYQIVHHLLGAPSAWAAAPEELEAYRRRLQARSRWRTAGRAARS